MYRCSVLLILIIWSCSSSELDRAFTLKTYQHDFKMISKSKEVDQSDLVLLNYAILRHRDHYNYVIEDKSYGDILDMAKTFEATGLSVDEHYDENGDEVQIEQRVKDIDLGYIQVKQSKRIRKVFTFSCAYTNTSDSDVALTGSSFIINGLLRKHITTVGYELNCRLKASSTITVHFLVDAGIIRENILYNTPIVKANLGIDQILPRLHVLPSGLSINNDIREFGACKFGGSRVEPFKAFNYKDITDRNSIKYEKREDGRYTIYYGNAHYIPEFDSEQIIQAH